jgi:uncharacterized YigZ family protein
MPSYMTPAANHRTEIYVGNSRFVTTIRQTASVEDAKRFLADLRASMPDASHHVYAFRVGYGNSVTEGMSDDGEPSGTAGPPVLAVLRGTQIGDITIVVTRYFGGTKLGTGGLVRAYTQAAQTGLATLKIVEKIDKQSLQMSFSYPLYERVKRLIITHGGDIVNETFEVAVTLVAVFPVTNVGAFTEDLQELSAGHVVPVPMSQE